MGAQTREARTLGILTRSEILKAIENGSIGIDPFDPQRVGPASVDLHLGNEFRTFKKTHRIVQVTNDVDYRAVTEKVVVPDGQSLVLVPGETVLGITRETVRLADNLCGWLEGRSRFARLGLLVHISASFMQPGIENQQVLEMSNFSPMALAVHPGTAICQFVFQQTVGHARYEGEFKTQSAETY